MTISEVKNVVLESSKSDWERFEDKGIFVYKNDVELRIQSDKKSEDELTLDWIKYPDNSVYYCKYLVYYKNSLVDEVELIDVDGCRATIPLYTPTSKEKPFDEAIARIVDSLDSTNNYIDRAKRMLNLE